MSYSRINGTLTLNVIVVDVAKNIFPQTSDRNRSRSRSKILLRKLHMYCCYCSIVALAYSNFSVSIVNVVLFTLSVMIILLVKIKLSSPMFISTTCCRVIHQIPFSAAHKKIMFSSVKIQSHFSFVFCFHQRRNVCIFIF